MTNNGNAPQPVTQNEGTPIHLSESLTVSADGWTLTEHGSDPDRQVAVGSNFLVGNGYLGYRGTAPEHDADRYVALILSDTYDCADGRWSELVSAPNPLYVSARLDNDQLAVESASQVDTALDLRRGLFRQRCVHRRGSITITIQVERFSSSVRLGVLAQRWTITADGPIDVDVTRGVDGDTWDLNGIHLPRLTLIEGDGGVLTATGRTVESGIEVTVACSYDTSDEVETAFIRAPRRLLQTASVSLTPDRPYVIDVFATAASSNDGPSSGERAIDTTVAARNAGFDVLLAESAIRWDAIWAAIEVTIAGSPIDQAMLRFNACHNRICVPAHASHLPIGARGLSCQAYQGAAFWDQEIYNLPAFLYTEPDIARSLLEYRHHTLDGARRKAARLGYEGAYYAWISGATGDELCPDVFFDDVITGRPIRNHFNDWQMHISPDIVYAIANYVTVTGDDDFLVAHGAEIVFEVARFIRSFVRRDHRGVHHCMRVLGPDEWHENVDDNAFTNHQVHAALTVAIETHSHLAAAHPDGLAELVQQMDLTPREVDAWSSIRDNILLPAPDPGSGVIEQFAGFFRLEDTSPNILRSRLLDPAEYWGWPNGVAVHTQVSKQADVAMALWLHPQRFDEATCKANYHYYEPRCSHNSSLSHAAFGMVAARIGDTDAALRHFRATSSVDLLNTNHAVVGGTFIGGIHTAACGGTYQLAVQGFGGLRSDGERLIVDPALPRDWSRLTFPVNWRSRRAVVEVSHDEVTVTVDPRNTTCLRVVVAGQAAELGPGNVYDGITHADRLRGVPIGQRSRGKVARVRSQGTSGRVGY